MKHLYRVTNASQRVLCYQVAESAADAVFSVGECGDRREAERKSKAYASAEAFRIAKGAAA